jgi:hypothetical protein
MNERFSKNRREMLQSGGASTVRAQSSRGVERDIIRTKGLSPTNQNYEMKGLGKVL